MAEKIKSPKGLDSYREIGPTKSVNFEYWTDGEYDFEWQLYFGASSMFSDGYFLINSSMDYVAQSAPILGFYSLDGMDGRTQVNFGSPKTGGTLSQLFGTKQGVSYLYFNTVVGNNPIVIKRIILNLNNENVWDYLNHITTFVGDFTAIHKDKFDLKMFNIPTELRGTVKPEVSTPILDTEIILTDTSGFYLGIQPTDKITKNNRLKITFEFAAVNL